MAKTSLNIENALLDEVNGVVEAHARAGQSVTKTQVFADAVRLYTDTVSPDLKLAAFIRDHYPVDTDDTAIDAWYDQFIQSS